MHMRMRIGTGARNSRYSCACISAHADSRGRGFEHSFTMHRLRRLLVVGGVAGTVGVGLVAFLNSSWGPKARDSVKEFYRASYNPPPPHWTEPVFKPRLDFSTARPNVKDLPWEKIDFKTEPEKYLRAALEYCFDGNLEHDFVPQKNPKRRWYHAPWMCQTPFGREPIHGMVFARPLPVGCLADTQKRVCQTWAVGMYNEPGKKCIYLQFCTHL